MKEKKITIYDIAREAGVSVGTVNRALGGKTRIRPETKQAVLDTAKRLGYRANFAAQSLRRAPITLGAILFCPIDEYVDAIIDGMRTTADALDKYNVTVDIQKIDYTDNADCLRRAEELLRAFSEAKYQGVVLFLSAMLDELDSIRALIDEVTEGGMTVATVANDIPGSNRVLHVGVDAHMAGQMAAELLSMSCSGSDVALMVTSKNSPVNMEYIKGFFAYARDKLFRNVQIYEHFDDKHRVTQVTERMLSENPDLRGIYMATASSSIACECIRGRTDLNLTIITTDLLRKTPEFLKNRLSTAVIFQNPYRQGKNVLRALYDHITQKTGEDISLIAPHILLSSNVEAYLSQKNM